VTGPSYILIGDAQGRARGYGFAPEPPEGLLTLGSEKAVATTVSGLWLASSYGGFGGYTGVMLTGMLAAQAAMKSQHSHPSVITTST
jgi:hypothetical protein